VKITPVGGFPLSIHGLSYNKQLFEASYKQIEGSSWEIELALKPFKTTGFLKETVLVANNSKTLPQFKVVVRAKLQGPIRYEPNYVEFGAVAREGQTKRLVRLAAQSPFQIKKSWLEISLNGKTLANPHEHFSIVSHDENPQAKDIEVTLHHSASPSGSVHGKLFLETSDELQKHIVLDFYGFFL